MRKDFIQQRFRRKNQEGIIGGGRNGGGSGKEESDQQQQLLQLAAAASAMNLAAALESQQQEIGMTGNSAENGLGSPQAKIVTSTDANGGKMPSTTAAEALLQTHLLNGLLEQRSQ